MSKIETALAKARGRVVRVASNEGATAPGKGIVPLEDRIQANREAERLAAAKALVRLEEPWLLDSDALAERRIVNVETANPEAVMVLRDLRTKILQVAQKNCTIMVTASKKGGDCSFVAANLAVSFANDDSKTALLLDCSLGAPLFEELIPAGEVFGITDYLKNDNVRVDQIIHPVGIRRLRVIPRGRSHDKLAEYFTMAKMRSLLREVRERYPDRYVVLGAPPITESADASILTELADYAILVVPYGTANESEIGDAAKMIGAKKLLGVVFTDLPTLPKERLRLSGWFTALLPFRRKRDR